MAKFLNTSKAYAEIEDIIDKASSNVVLISPYIKFPETLLQRLKYVDKKNIKITVVCRKGDLKDDVRSDLMQLKNLELRFDEHLHAKCFYNEESMVITSLNLLEYSQQHNREMGVLLSLKDDHRVFNEARNEAEFIVSGADEEGFCIRCGTSIPNNPHYPFCPSCNKQWTEQENHNYECEQSFCHTCGQPEPSTFARPNCNSCHHKKLAR